MPQILIADRDAAIATLLQAAVCRAFDCDVTLAHDAATAASAIQTTAFDLVLLDIGMYSEGLETLRRVRDQNGRCKVIALTTGVIAAPLLRTLAHADVFAVVTKPFDIEQLAATAVECLRPDRHPTPNRPLVYRGPGSDPTPD